MVEAKEQVQCVHHLSCEDSDISLIGAFIGKDIILLKWIRKLTKGCATCKEPL